MTQRWIYSYADSFLFLFPLTFWFFMVYYSQEFNQTPIIESEIDGNVTFG